MAIGTSKILRGNQGGHAGFVTATIDENTLFIVELQYAGLIKSVLKNEEDKKNLIISGSYFLFPNARNIISNITMEGGYKPLIIQPIKFENMFQK